MKKTLSTLFILLVMATVAITDSTSFTIHVIGDSTVATYKSSVYPQTGWGQVVGSFFNESQVLINNVAIGGRSSKTFFTDGRLAALKSQVKPGDYLFVQFGHNDRYFGSNARQVPLDSFAYFLKIYLDSARSWNAIPVLVSPMVMNAWASNGTMRNVFTESGADYRGVMEKLAKEQDVAFIDLNMRSYEDCKKWGQSYITSFLYHHYDVGDYPNWPQGSNDNTHFQENGSVSNARWIANEISSLSSSTYLSNATKQKLLPLIDALKPHYVVTVKANKSVSGLISKTASFPAGAPLTLRVKPASGETFEYWADAACNKVSTSKIYYGIQAPSGPTTYTAMFKGGSACVQASVPSSSSNEVSSSSSVEVSSSSVIVIRPEILSWVDMANPDSGSGTTDVNHEGYTGEGFWNIENVLGSKAFYQLESKNASTNAVMAIRYANGSTETRSMKVTLDGWTYSVVFPPTETWATWDTIFVEDVWIDAVSMPLVIESTSEIGGPNIDALGFSVLGLTRESSITSIEVISKNKSLLFSNNNPVQILLFDALGTCFLNQQFSSFEYENFMSSLAPGVYYIKGIQEGKTFFEQRVTKKK
jgi:lysophospholipase L1-like esterase